MALLIDFDGTIRETTASLARAGTWLGKSMVWFGRDPGDMLMIAAWFPLSKAQRDALPALIDEAYAETGDYEVRVATMDERDNMRSMELTGVVDSSQVVASLESLVGRHYVASSFDGLAGKPAAVWMLAMKTFERPPPADEVDSSRAQARGSTVYRWVLRPQDGSWPSREAFLRDWLPKMELFDPEGWTYEQLARMFSKPLFSDNLRLVRVAPDGSWKSPK